MASALTLYMGNALARWFCGEAMPTAPTALYFALYDGDPKGSGTDVTDDVNSAGRQTGTFTAPSVGVVNEASNDAELDFGDSEGAVSITHVAAFDASTSGNMLAVAALNTPVAVEAADPVSFEAGGLLFRFGS